MAAAFLEVMSLEPCFVFQHSICSSLWSLWAEVNPLQLQALPHEME